MVEIEGEAIEKKSELDSQVRRGWVGQTPLERIGRAMRNKSAMRNEWGPNREYTKALVLAEYNIQQEFKVK